MPEEGPLYEAWATVQNRFQRVYRGRNIDHLDWKMTEYKKNKCGPKAYMIQVDPQGDELRIELEKKN